VETFIHWPGYSDPGAVLTFGQARSARADALGRGRDDTVSNATLRVDLRVLLAGLVQGRGLEILHYWFVCLCRGWQAGQEYESKNGSFHDDISSVWLMGMIFCCF
jgi:hypothetical protein